MADTASSRSKGDKYLIFVLDGMADLPCPELGGKTPLEAADTPQLDRLAREGACGLLQTVPERCAPGSEVANLSILSYDPETKNPGRGVLEAASMGLELDPDSITMRTNLVSMENGTITDHSAGHISSEEAAQLIEALNDTLDVTGIMLYPGVSYRHILTIKGGSERVECTPPHDILTQLYEPHLPRALDQEGGETAALLCKVILRSQELLKNRPVNLARRQAGKRTADSLWPWSPGRKPSIAPIHHRFGLTGAVISAVDLIKGIGKLAGLEVLTVPGATGLPETNYEGKAEAAADALDLHDFVYVHVEGPDEAGHAGDPELKRRAIAWSSQRLIGRALDLLTERGLRNRTTIAVLPDHFTPCELRTHDRMPVPYLISGGAVRPDHVTAFSEKNAAGGALGLSKGTEFLGRLFGRT